MNPFAPSSSIAVAAAIACGALLAACGGGSGSPADPGPPPASLSQAEATSDASDAEQPAAAGASALDDVFDTTQAMAGAATTAPGSSVTVDCAGGGSAIVAISGGTAAGVVNGALDAGEHYDIVFEQCRGQAGRAALDGSVSIDIDAVADGASPATTMTITPHGLNVATPLGSIVLGGFATLERSSTTDGTTSTTISHLTSPGFGIDTAFNGRQGHLQMIDVDWTRTVSSRDGVVTGSQFTGHHQLRGNANDFAFSQSVSTVGAVSYAADGTPVAGRWTTVRPESTIATTIAAGLVTLTLDIGSNGSIERSWTFPLAQLDAAAG